jgi:hypothetical protein
LEQAKAVYNHISTEPNRTRMGFGAGTPGGIFFDTIFTPGLAELETAVRVYDNPATHTPANLALLHTAKKKLIKSFRELYSGYIRNNRAVTDGDRTEMLLPLLNTKRTPYIHKFHGADCAKYFHFAIRWVANTSKAGAGDYCTVQNTLIP